MVIFNKFLSKNTLFLDKKLWKMTIVLPKCALWRSICADTVDIKDHNSNQSKIVLLIVSECTSVGCNHHCQITVTNILHPIIVKLPSNICSLALQEPPYILVLLSSHVFQTTKWKQHTYRLL